MINPKIIKVGSKEFTITAQYTIIFNGNPLCEKELTTNLDIKFLETFKSMYPDSVIQAV